MVREHLDVTAGARLVWDVLPDGRILVRAKTKSILDMAGSVKPPRGKRVRVEKTTKIEGAALLA